eukprot:3328215-Prymnesium_polylepis.1
MQLASNMADRDRSWTCALRIARGGAAAASVGDGRAGLRRPDHLLRTNKRDEKLPTLRVGIPGHRRGYSYLYIPRRRRRTTHLTGSETYRRGWRGDVDWNVVGEGPRGTHRERRDQHCQHCVSEAVDGAAASQDSQASLDEVDECRNASRP